MTRWVFVTQFRMGTNPVLLELVFFPWRGWRSASGIPVSSGSSVSGWFSWELMASLLPYKAAVPVEARLSQLENTKLWAFPDDICSFSNTHLASLVPCSAVIMQSQLGRFFILWNLYIFCSDISKIITEVFLSGWVIVNLNHSSDISCN